MSSSGTVSPPPSTMKVDRSDQPTELEHEERLEYYNVEGFHPVNLGDVIDERYRILCKLGCGAYATIWLAEGIE